MPNHGNNQFDKTYRLKDVNRQTSSWMHEILHYLLILFAYQILFSWIIIYANKKNLKKWYCTFYIAVMV